MLQAGPGCARKNLPHEQLNIPVFLSPPLPPAQDRAPEVFAPTVNGALADAGGLRHGANFLCVLFNFVSGFVQFVLVYRFWRCCLFWLGIFSRATAVNSPVPFPGGVVPLRLLVVVGRAEWGLFLLLLFCTVCLMRAKVQ